MNGNAIVTRGERVAFQRLDEGGVLLHLGTGAYHRVNGVGALIWEALGDGKLLSDVVKAVEESVDGEVPDDLSTDVEQFIGSLAQRDLVAVSDG